MGKLPMDHSHSNQSGGQNHTPPGEMGRIGWFTATWQRLFGSRDPVEAQLRDIARQGTFGAMISHFFATLLIILFSTASLIALGADSMRAVLVSLAHGSVDIPNAVATGVTALLVPAMDVAMLRAASKIRLLATRRATRSEMALHVVVMATISAIEAGTYCYMAAIYEHPGSGVAWALIIARAASAPLIGVYLAMDRPHPVTSRDILAQVELGAGAGVIRDVTEIANDASATLDRKMELFGASAVMREHERDRLNDLITVAKKHATSQPSQPSQQPTMLDVFSRNGHKAAVGAPVTLPLVPAPQEHIEAAYSPYRAMHDGDEDTNYGITDEVSDDDLDADVGGWSTSSFAENELIGSDAGEDVTTSTKPRSRSQSNSGPNRRSQQASKTARQAHKKMRLESKQARKRLVRDGAFTIFDKMETSGEHLSWGEIAKRVAKMQHLETTPSDNTINRLWGPWQASRKHKALIEAQEAQDTAPIPDDIMAMLETEPEEAEEALV